jgi:hypothetical protein
LVATAGAREAERDWFRWLVAGGTVRARTVVRYCLAGRRLARPTQGFTIQAQA